MQRNGSDQVANYIKSGYGEGSIGYDEYAFALNLGIPVVKVLNSAGYYSLPTPSNVAIALQAAVIDENPSSPTFLMQNLDHVYTNPDPRTYPLSSYSYLIIPRTSRVINGNQAGPPPRFNTDKGKTLSTWMNYVLCGAQQKAGKLGYSPLPKNLVVGGFKQIDQMPGHVKTPNLQQLNGCNNPTYSDGVNHLIKDAPMPSPCDKVGAALTCTGTARRRRPATARLRARPGRPVRRNGSGTARRPTGNGDGSGTGTGRVRRADRRRERLGNRRRARPTDTGLPANTGSGSGGNGDVLPCRPCRSRWPSLPDDQNWLLATFTTVDIIAAIAIPSLLTAWLRRRRRAVG